MPKNMPDREQMTFRFDVISRVIRADEDGNVEMIWIPDPRRYEWRTRDDGRRDLYDKLDDVYITQAALAGMAEQLGGQPMFFERQEIDDAVEYARSRKEAIAARLRREHEEPTFEDKSEAFLRSLAVNELEFVILSVDIVGSTKLATTADRDSYRRAVTSALYEFSEVVPKFRGYVLKYTGDGLIAYFPAPTFIRKNDLALDCALTIRRLVYDGLHPILRQHRLPTLDVRIGLDGGEAFVEVVGSPAAKQHMDIIGDVVSLAAKVQDFAEPGEIYLGQIVVQNLHTAWRQMCEPVELGPGWTYRRRSGDLYPVYRVSPLADSSNAS